MAVIRTFRKDAEPVVHIVTDTWSRGFNGTDFMTRCGQRLATSEKWAQTGDDVPTCVCCIGTQKKCAWCDGPIHHPRFAWDTKERCQDCL